MKQKKIYKNATKKIYLLAIEREREWIKKKNNLKIRKYE